MKPKRPLIAIPALGLSILLSAASGAIAAEDTCRVLGQALALHGADHDRCVRDAGFRDRLVRDRLPEAARSLAASHDRGLDLFIDADKEVASFSRFASVAAVPETYRRLVVPLDRYGRRFVVPGVVVAAAGSDGGPFLIEARGTGGERFLMLGDRLDDARRAFLARHCGIAPGRRSSMCAGDLFVEVVANDALFGIAHVQLLGAWFRPADEARVLTALGGR